MRSVVELSPTPMGCRSQMLNTSILQERSFIREESELTTSRTKQEFGSSWLILTSQSHYATTISQSHDGSWEQSSSQRQKSDHTHGSSYLLEQSISYTILNKNRDSYTCQNTNLCLQEATDLPPVVTLPQFQSLKLGVRQGNCPLFRNRKHTITR
jgi:hypothetical protein